MLPRLLPCLAFACLSFSTGALTAIAQSKPPRAVWNYDGGLAMMTNGSLSNGACFRLSGKVGAPQFFTDLKRVDGPAGTVYRRGNDAVTEFPERLRLSLVIYDMPCDDRLGSGGPPVILTPEMIGALRVSFFWKRGMRLRPLAGAALVHTEAKPVPRYANELSANLAQKYQWWFEFDLPAANVPLTDSLVLVVRSADEPQRIAARVAARL